MVWKLYKMMAQVLFRYVIAACFDHPNSGEMEAQINKLYRLERIIACVRQYYGLQPNFVRDTYGTMENYIKQHISEHDWALLTQLQVVKSDQSVSLHKPVLDIA